MKHRKDDPGSDTIIGKGAVLRGKLQIERNLLVDGTLSGERIAATEALIVGEEGKVESKLIQVGQAHIKGKVTGDLKAREQVRVSAGGILEGRVETPRLVLEEGAVIKANGRED